MIRKYPVFVLVITVCVLLTIAQVVYIFMSLGANSEAKDAYSSTITQSRSVVTLTPRPTTENVTASEENIKELQAAEAKIIQAFEGKTGEEIAPASEIEEIDSSDLFFRLQSFIEELRAQGNQKDIEQVMRDGELVEQENPYLTLPEEITFGFGHFIDIGKGPEPEFIREVFIQHRVINFLMRKLYDAKPESIVQVLRDPITVQINPKQMNSNQDKLPKDTFLIDPLTTARESGVIHTYAFKIIFTGYTKSLRLFLTSLEAFDWPLVVRSVEAKPAEVQKAKKSNQQNNDLFAMFGNIEDGEAKKEEFEKAKTPVVENNVSEFTVIIELIEVVQPDDSTAATAQAGGNQP